jgi:two-component system phosphate regulon response regulator PhoB
MVTVLVVTRDREQAQLVVRGLEQQGLGVIESEDPLEALKRVRADPPDAIILEMFLSEQSGFALCKTLRETPEGQSIPILMLTASSSEMDRILAFEAGADDVLARPFYPRELALRVRALMRRASRGAADLARYGARLEHGPLRVDAARKKLWSDGREVRLTDKELRILILLLSQPGRVFTREEILAQVWAGESERTPRVVDTHMKGIRRKLGDNAAIVESLRGVGYRLGDSTEEP